MTILFTVAVIVEEIMPRREDRSVVNYYCTSRTHVIISSQRDVSTDRQLVCMRHIRQTNYRFRAA